MTQVGHDPPGDRGGGRLIGWRSGGWVLLLAFVLVLLVSVWRVTPMLRSRGSALGDGRHVDSYGFDLSTCLVSRETLVPAGFPRDGVPPLDEPRVMRADELASFDERHRGTYLVDSDAVIGIVSGGQARAYPLRVMNWHEVANDTLGGVPIAVTYNPLCDSVVVFDRRVAGRTLEFGVSGLLFNSNLLMYDRKAAAGEASLWSQLQARAISGPAARDELRLEVLPASLARWGVWKRRHPDTTLVEPEASKLKRYERDPYGNYLRTGKLRFPVSPLPPGDVPATMDRVMVVERGGARRVLWIDAGRIGSGRVSIDGTPDEPWIDSDASELPVSLIVEDARGASVRYSAWFAWYAQHPEISPDEVGRAMALQP